jgi:polyvinyl alcohol dehydrogenase (cytochrome)
VEMLGPSGAPIWSTPAIDERRGLLYAGTGENTSPPATKTSDAIVAVDLLNGEGRWVRQTLANDIWNMACPPSAKTAGPNCFFQEGYGSVLLDYDFGAGPILAKRANGKDVVLAGQKSGHVWALDPDNGGKVLWSERFGQGTALGGIHWGMAIDGKRVFAPINDPTESPASRPGLNALDISTGKVLWRWAPEPDCANGRDKRVPTCGYKIGLSAAPMVVDRAVITGSLDGKVRIFEAATGKLLFTYDTARPFETLSGVAGNGGSIDSHSVFAGAGMVFVGSGYGAFSQTPGNVLIAFRPGAKASPARRAAP